MAVSRLRRVGILLLVLWLAADVAAIGFCSDELLRAAGTAVSIGAADLSDGTSPCCTGHQCFCCSSGAEVVTFSLPVEERAKIMTRPAASSAPDISLAHTSPPPRL